MTLVSELVQRGYRENNLLPAGTAPNAAQLAEGLQLLNGLQLAVFGDVTSEPLMDWLVPIIQRTASFPADYPLYGGAQYDANKYNPAAPPCDARVVWNGSEQQVFFPTEPYDGARFAFVQASGAAPNTQPGVLTLDGNGNWIDGADTWSPPAGVTHRQWFYRADLATWHSIGELALTDENPFPGDFDPYWETSLAIRLSPRYGKVIQPGTQSVFAMMDTKIRARYASTHPVDAGGRTLKPGFESFNQTYGWWR